MIAAKEPRPRAPAAGRGSPAIRFLGRIPPDELGPFYRHALALLAPSVGFETGGTLIEAFRAGTPVLARAVGPHPEIMERADAGFLFSNADELPRLLAALTAEPAAGAPRTPGRSAFLRHWSEKAVVPFYPTSSSAHGPTGGLARERSLSAPRLRRYPLVGHTPAFLADRLGFLDTAAESGAGGRASDRPPDVPPRRRLGGAPRARRERGQLREEPRLTSRRGRRVSGAGVLTASGAAHRAHRRQLQPDFTQRAVAPYAEVMAETTAEQLGTWRPGEELDVADEMTTIARRIIIRILLGRLSLRTSSASRRRSSAAPPHRARVPFALPAPDRCRRA